MTAISERRVNKNILIAAGLTAAVVGGLGFGRVLPSGGEVKVPAASAANGNPFPEKSNPISNPSATIEISSRSPQATETLNQSVTIDSLFAESLSNPDQERAATTLKTWLTYLDGTQTSGGRVDIGTGATSISSKIQNLDEFAPEIANLLNGGVSSVPLRVRSHLVFDNSVDGNYLGSWKRDILFEISDVTLDKDLIPADGSDTATGIKFNYRYAYVHEDIGGEVNSARDKDKLHGWLQSPSTLQIPPLSKPVEALENYVLVKTDLNGQKNVVFTDAIGKIDQSLTHWHTILVPFFSWTTYDGPSIPGRGSLGGGHYEKLSFSDLK